MAKNPFDKYYTQETEIKKTMELVRKHIPLKEIAEIIEPAAGDGAFIPEIKKLAEELNVPYKFYDLYPEHPEIEKKDFNDLMKELEYKKGRLFIGNPPFGNASSLFKRFRNGAVEKGDWAVYIGPASHWNMKWGLKGMELVHSEHLGGVEYRGLENKKVNTCINVYRRISGNIVDRRMEMLERDFEIHIIKYYNNGIYREENWDSFDYYLTGYGPNIGKIENIPTNSSSWGIKILNEEIRNKAIIYLNSFYEKNKDEIKKQCVKSPNIKIDFLKQKMIEEFYPTREEMLERDFEICYMLKYKNGRFSENNGFPKKDWNTYDFYLNQFWGKREIEPEMSSIGIKVLNNNLFNKTELFVNNFYEKNKEYLKKTGNGGMGNIQISWFKQKMIEEFYPTREEMLGRDFEIKSIANNTSSDVINNCSETFDFFINQYNTKEPGKLIENAIIPCWCIKVKNEKLKNKAEIFFREFGEKYREEIKKHTSSGINVRKPFLIEKMIEEFYPTREEMLERDFDIKMLNNDKKYREGTGHYLGFFGDGITGRYTNNPKKWKTVFEIKILNKKIEEKAIEFLKGFYDNNFEEIKTLNSSATASMNLGILKQKMIEHFYPTREEMLERDFGFFQRNQNKYTKLKEADFYISSFRSVGELNKDAELTIGIILKNKELYDKTKIFLETFKINYYDEILMSSCGPKAITQDFLKQKMIEEFYPDVPEYFEHTYVEDKNKEQIYKRNKALALF